MLCSASRRKSLAWLSAQPSDETDEIAFCEWSCLRGHNKKGLKLLISNLVLSISFEHCEDGLKYPRRSWILLTVNYVSDRTRAQVLQCTRRAGSNGEKQVSHRYGKLIFDTRLHFRKLKYRNILKTNKHTNKQDNKKNNPGLRWIRTDNSENPLCTASPCLRLGNHSLRSWNEVFVQSVLTEQKRNEYKPFAQACHPWRISVKRSVSLLWKANTYKYYN